MKKGEKLKGALAKSPRSQEKVVRVSPGVYRMADGRTVTPKGGQMDPRRIQQRPQPVQDLGQVLGAVAGQPNNPSQPESLALGFTPSKTANWQMMPDAGFSGMPVGQSVGNMPFDQYLQQLGQQYRTGNFRQQQNVGVGNQMPSAAANMLYGPNYGRR